MPSEPATAAHALVAQNPLLKEFAPRELEGLIAHARFQRYPAHQVIFQRGDPGTSMMSVVTGRVKISAYSADGREVIFNIIEPGHVFGEIALLDGKERTADATAMEPSELLVIDRRDFMPFLARHPEIAVKLVDVLCERLRRTSEQVEYTLILDRPGRLARLLVRLAADYGHPTPAGTRIDLKLSQTDLGNMVGMTRESMNKQLSEWREEGLIQLDERLITICDLEEFRLLGGGLV